MENDSSIKLIGEACKFKRVPAKLRAFSKYYNCEATIEVVKGFIFETFTFKAKGKRENILKLINFIKELMSPNDRHQIDEKIKEK